MKPTEARTFSRYSVRNAAAVKSALACGCEPYQDVYTYNRWKALGFQVQRGEKAIRIPVIKSVEVEDKDTGEITTRKLLGGGAAFCRHQVQPINGAKRTPAAAPAARPALPAPAPATRSEPIQSNDAAKSIMSTWKEV